MCHFCRSQARSCKKTEKPDFLPEKSQKKSSVRFSAKRADSYPPTHPGALPGEGRRRRRKPTPSRLPASAVSSDHLIAASDRCFCFRFRLLPEADADAVQASGFRCFL